MERDLAADADSLVEVQQVRETAQHVLTIIDAL
jgi:hypothetical protein